MPNIDSHNIRIIIIYTNNNTICSTHFIFNVNFFIFIKQSWPQAVGSIKNINKTNVSAANKWHNMYDKEVLLTTLFTPTISYTNPRERNL